MALLVLVSFLLLSAQGFFVGQPRPGILWIGGQEVRVLFASLVMLVKISYSFEGRWTQST